MACVTLKRPLEWIDPSMSPESGSSSPTHMIISNSPPHHGLRSPKRMCLQNISSQSSSPQSSCHFSSFIASPTTAAAVPHQTNSFIGCGGSNFGTSAASTIQSNNFFKPISSSEIADQIREEMLRLRFIRRSSATNAKPVLVNKHASQIHSDQGNKSPSESSMGTPSPSSSPQRQHDGGGGSVAAANASALSLNTSSNTGAATAAATSADGTETTSTTTNKSSQPSSSSSNVAAYNFLSCLIGTGNGSQQQNDDVENYHQHNSKNQNNLLHSSSAVKKTMMMAAANKCLAASSNSSSASCANGGKLSKCSDNKPLFTFNQVVMIVERLLRDKEESLQREFEAILAARLAEQYDQFVKFSYDQIQRRFDSQALPSYLS